MGTLLDAADFAGVSRSFTIVRARGWPECRKCGSTLFRREGVRNRGTLEVELFRCRCGAGRHVTRELAAA